MKVAVTVWEERISPVFDASRRLLIADIEDHRITNRSTLLFDPALPAKLASMLKDIDVPVLICGAVSRVPASIISAAGVTLIPFITGDVDRVLTAYARGTSLIPTFVMPGCQDALPGKEKRNRHRQSE